MPTIVEQLGALDFTAIDDALGRVRISVDVDTGLDPAALDVGTLLGDLGTAIAVVEDLEADPDAIVRLATTALAELGDLVALPDVGELDDVVTAIATLVALVEEAVAILADDGGDLVDRLLTQVGQTLDLSTLVDDVVGRVADGFGFQVPAPLEAAFDRLAALGAGVTDPRALAELLLDTFATLDLDALDALAGGLDTAVGIVVAAGDHGPVALLLAEIDVELDLAVAAGGRAAVDVAALDELVAAVARLSVLLDRLVDTTLPHYVDGVTTDLRTARNQLVELDVGGRLEGLLASLPRPGVDPLALLVGPLRDIATRLDDVTASSVAAAIEVAREELLSLTEAGPLGELLTGIEDLQARLVAQVRGLPLEQVRDTVVVALRDLQGEILRFEGFAFLDDLVAPIRELVPLLDGLDTSTLTDAVQGLVDLVEGVFDDFPIEDLRDAIDVVVDPLGAILAEAEPLIEGITTQLEALVAELDGIDFDAAGAQVLEALAEIREQVQGALDTDSVPDALKAVIAGAASVLREMDLAVELSTPFDDAVATIDVDAVLEPVTALWDELGAALERATPEALVAELDPPFDELLDGLDDISLAPLTDALSDLFDQLLGTLRSVDPRVLVAPLEGVFQDLLDTVRATVDPAPLFAPLQQAWAAVHDAVAAIDLEAAMGELLGGIAGTPGMLTGAVEQELASRSDGSGPPIPVAAAEAFRFGDILRPFAALVAEIRGRLHGLADGLVGEALGQVADVTRSLRGLLAPATSAAVGIADGIDARRGWFDAAVADGPLAGTAARLAGLQAMLDDLDLDAAGRARLDASLGPVRLEARVELDVAVTAPARTEMARTAEAGAPSGLGRSMRLLARALDDLLPAPLLDDTLDPRAGVTVFVDALVDAVDPAPLVAELDDIGDRIQAKLATFVDELSVGLLSLWNELFAGLSPLMPGSVAARLQAVLDAVVAELAVLDPTPIEDEARATIDAAIGLLDLHSPAAVAAELGLVVDAALALVEDLDPGELLGDLDPFAGLRTDLEVLRPSTVLAPLVDRTASITAALEAVAALDLDIAGELVVEVKAAFSAVLDGVEREWEALLDELSAIGGGASVSVSIGT